VEKLLAFIVAAIIALTAHLYSNNYLGDKFSMQEFYNHAGFSVSSSKHKSGSKSGNNVRWTSTKNHK